MPPSEQGARTEAAVASALARSGAQVFVPVFGSAGRIDLVYTRLDRAVRVQCKTARRVDDSLYFSTCSNTKNERASYDGQIDEFGVYSPDTNLVYLISAGGLPTRACSLRLAPPRNGQRARIRWAADYELGPP